MARRALLIEHRIKLRYARMPYLFIRIQKVLNVKQSGWVGLNEALPALPPFNDEPRSFQHRHMLLHGSKRYVVFGRQLRDIRRARQSSANNVASGSIGKCSKDSINLAVCGGN